MLALKPRSILFFIGIMSLLTFGHVRLSALLIAQVNADEDLKAHSMHTLIERCPKNAGFIFAFENAGALMELWRKDKAFQKDIAPLLNVLKQTREQDDTAKALFNALGMKEEEVIEHFLGGAIAVVMDKPPQENNQNTFVLFKPKPGMIAMAIQRLALEELVDLPRNLNGVRVFRSSDDQAYIGVIGQWCYLADRGSREFLRSSAVSLLAGKSLKDRKGFTERWLPIHQALSKDRGIDEDTIGQGLLYTDGVAGEHVIGMHVNRNTKRDTFSKININYQGTSPKWKFSYRQMVKDQLLLTNQRHLQLPVQSLCHISTYIKPDMPIENQRFNTLLNKMLFGRPRLRTKLKRTYHNTILPELTGELHGGLVQAEGRTSWYFLVGIKKSEQLKPYFDRVMKRMVFLLNIARAEQDLEPLHIMDFKKPDLNCSILELPPKELAKNKGTLTFSNGKTWPFFHGLAFGEMTVQNQPYYFVATDPAWLNKDRKQIAQSDETFDHRLAQMKIPELKNFMLALNKLRGDRDNLEAANLNHTLDDFQKIYLFTRFIRNATMQIDVTSTSDLSISMQLNR